MRYPLGCFSSRLSWSLFGLSKLLPLLCSPANVRMAASSGKDKVLVFGSNAAGAPGSLKALLTKITGINSKHGPFACVLCLGDMFPADEDDSDADVGALLDGSLAVPCPVYCMIGSRALPKRIAARAEAGHGQVCENLAFLGKQTVLTMSSGLKIATFGGSFDLEAFTAEASSSTSPSFTSASLDSFIANPALNNVDILLAHTWPSQLSRYSEKPIPIEGVDPQDAASANAWGIPALHKLYARAKPKYAFSGEKNVFWEREPFVYPSDPNSASDGARTQYATRFLSLGHFANTAKQRQFYAFSIAPTSTLSADSAASELPANITPCPFDTQHQGSSSGKGIKRSLPQDDFDDGGGNSYIFAGGDGNQGAGRKKRHGDPPPSYKCKICGVPGHFVQDCPEKVDKPPAAKNGAKGPPPETYVCRLCNVSGHWIQDCPMAGQQSEERRSKPKEIGPQECWFCLSNPKVTKHLIASIGSEAYLTLPKGQLLDTSDADTVVPGGGHVLIIPIAHYPTLSAIPAEDSGPVQAEISAYKRALQACYEQYGAKMFAWEISRTGGAKSAHAHIQAGQVQSVFEEEAEKAGYDFKSDAGECAQILQSGNYFRLDLPDGSKRVHAIKEGERFNLQFGRSTAALALGKPDRADWKACAKSDEDEAADKKKFTQVFSKHDPSG